MENFIAALAGVAVGLLILAVVWRFYRRPVTVKSRAATDHRQMVDDIQPDGDCDVRRYVCACGRPPTKCGCVRCETTRRNLP